MTAFKIATASVVLCSGLLFTSFLMAAEDVIPRNYAQMNRAAYDSPSVQAAPQVAQMNRADYDRPATPPRHPGTRVTLRAYALLTGTTAPVQVSAQMNRALYDR